MAVKVVRAGGKWEGIGFILILIGLFAFFASSLWGWLMLPGFIIFLIGRFQ